MRYLFFILNFILIIYTTYINAQQDYCQSVQEAGMTGCKDCVEITILGGRPDCAYCANPYAGMTHCQKPFYPPKINTPGFTIYACYNDSGPSSSGALDLLRYKPRCEESDCYIDQCLVSGKILWYYIVPSVIGFVIIVILVWIYFCKCYKTDKNKYIEEDNKREKQIKDKANKRQKEREIKMQTFKKKYSKNDFCVEEIV